MRKLYTIALAFILVPVELNAQWTFQIKVPRPVSILTVVDSGNVKIRYVLNKLKDESGKSDDIHVLEIGKNTSKYYSCNAFEEDSMSINLKKQPILGGSTKFTRNITQANKYFWSEYYKDHAQNMLTEYAYMPGAMPNYQYSEKIPVQDWTLQDDTLTVHGYLCQKATCSFRGRNYIAWFCTDIPINNGPWKFGGLPGLILKVYDERNDYDFECINIENHKTKFLITSYDYRDYGKIKREKLLKLWEDIFDHYWQLTNSQIIATSGNGEFEKLPYNPIELK
ncbi:GLPGLI family protein [Candidatus Symbiothrix dinenymphae]|uniref:GLPGLI family protein n=1 Tax=Candidatus Symbiothrix dinenymphae TaxID=467085 RepID=UPI0006C72765|nr:GLPGLI family protein [Candidatus Symbiothrix dinenymphae]GAP73341.1 hypothetical protein SAMD00024442_8_35 [Candidatus Symbiothrix dinenymphae]